MEFRGTPNFSDKRNSKCAGKHFNMFFSKASAAETHGRRISFAVFQAEMNGPLRFRTMPLRCLATLTGVAQLYPIGCFNTGKNTAKNKMFGYLCQNWTSFEIQTQYASGSKLVFQHQELSKPKDAELWPVTHGV